MSEILRIRIVFKSGHVEEMDFDEFSLRKSPVNGAMKEVQWRQTNLAEPKLEHIRLDEIACIISLPNTNSAGTPA